MGFNNTSILTAKLTPTGRRNLLSGTRNLITKFQLGDSDAAYITDETLGVGEVPSQSGDITQLSGVTNTGVSKDSKIKYPIFSTGSSTFKNVDTSSNNISVTDVKIGTTVLSGSSLSFDLIDLSVTTDTKVNLYSSFSLPSTTSQKSSFTGKTLTQGGFSNTALSGLSQDRILVIGIPNNQYGDMLDGKEVKLTLNGLTGGTYELYTTFQNKSNVSAIVEDSNFSEKSTNTATMFGGTHAFVFSDGIQRPNSDAGKSWSTGFGSSKPFSFGRKERFNIVDNSTLGLNTDKAVGVCHLNSGFIVVTDPVIVGDYSASASTANTVTFNSMNTLVSQEVLCMASRGEFVKSQNPTFSMGEAVRVSEIGLYDNDNNLIAYGKTNRHFTKSAADTKMFTVKISI